DPIAHAAALAHAGILTSEEREKIDKGLREIETEIENGKFEWDQSLEDVHMNIEAALTKRIGVAGAKLHTARSRNDQAALDLRLYVKAEIGEIRSGRLRSLQSALLNLAEQHIDVVMLGYTNLQRAQPIFFAHYLVLERMYVCRIRRWIVQRLEIDAAEKKSGHGRAYARQDWAALREFSIDLDHGEGAAFVFQSRSAGGQTCPV